VENSDASTKEEHLLEPDPSIYSVEDELEKELTNLKKRITGLENKTLELETSIEAYNAALEIHARRVNELETFYTAASIIGSWKASTCIYREGDTCKLWRLTPEAQSRLGPIVEHTEDGTPRINVAKAPWFCALCPLYRRATSRG
jgi:galactose-1-phosphate uridylyltransferase